MTTIPETREHDGYEINADGFGVYVWQRYSDTKKAVLIFVPFELLDQVCAAMQAEREKAK